MTDLLAGKQIGLLDSSSPAYQAVLFKTVSFNSSKLYNSVFEEE